MLSRLFCNDSRYVLRLMTLVGAVEGGFDGAELLDEFDGAFVADAGCAGDVVDGVAAEGHDVDDAFGRDAEGRLRRRRGRG